MLRIKKNDRNFTQRLNKNEFVDKDTKQAGMYELLKQATATRKQRPLHIEERPFILS